MNKLCYFLKWLYPALAAIFAANRSMAADSPPTLLSSTDATTFSTMCVIFSTTPGNSARTMAVTCHDHGQNVILLMDLFGNPVAYLEGNSLIMIDPSSPGQLVLIRHCRFDSIFRIVDGAPISDFAFNDSPEVSANKINWDWGGVYSAALAHKVHQVTDPATSLTRIRTAHSCFIGQPFDYNIDKSSRTAFMNLYSDTGKCYQIATIGDVPGPLKFPTISEDLLTRSKLKYTVREFAEVFHAPIGIATMHVGLTQENQSAFDDFAKLIPSRSWALHAAVLRVMRRLNYERSLALSLSDPEEKGALVNQLFEQRYAHLAAILHRDQNNPDEYAASIRDILDASDVVSRGKGMISNPNYLEFCQRCLSIGAANTWDPNFTEYLSRILKAVVADKGISDSAKLNVAEICLRFDCMQNAFFGEKTVAKTDIRTVDFGTLSKDLKANLTTDLKKVLTEKELDVVLKLGTE